MPTIIVSPLARIAELAVKHGAREMISLLAANQAFHRPAVIAKDRHLLLGVNDITFAGTGDLVAPQEMHVADIIHFAKSWDQSTPLLVHCWMGVSRSPAAAVIAALALDPEQDDFELATRLRAVSPVATPNSRLIEIGDNMLGRNGKLIAAIRSIGRGADADGNAPFFLDLRREAAVHA